MQAKDIQRITVVGAGTMGHGIGQDFASAGFEVVLYDLSEAILENAKNKIERNLQEQKEWGFFTASEVQSTLDRIHTTTVLQDAAAGADLVIEAVFEDLALKQQIFRELDQICAEHTILASNTSSLMPSTLASVTNRPDRVVVAHFFYPPPLMPLLEIVRSEFTSDETVNAVYSVAKAARKSPIIVQKEALGFIANRLQVALLREALNIVEQGIATAPEVDLAVKQSFGRRLSVAGPIEMAEVQDGWDLVLQVENYILPDLDTSREPSRLIFDMIERGHLGAKSGQGFYEWPEVRLEAWRQNLSKALAEFLRADRGSHRAGESE